LDRDEFWLEQSDAATERRDLTVSYILDALKKSEAERSRGVVPTLLAPRQTPLRSSVIGWVVAAALLVNAVVFAVWMYWPSTTETPRSPASGPVGASAILAAPTAAQAPPAVAVPPAAVDRTAPSPDLARTPFEAPAVTAAEDSSTNVDSSAAADGIGGAPRYPFSTHVYASDPSMRAVTLNGRRYTEGDTIDAGVRIKEITETGVVLDVGGRSVSVDVLQDWR